MRCCARWGAVTILGVLLWSSSALADYAQVVTLKTGARYRGVLIDDIPNDHVTLRLATGMIKKFPWADIASSEEVHVAEPTPPAGPVVHLRGEPSLRLELRTGEVEEVGYHWPPRYADVYRMQCTAPCDVPVPPGDYRVSGPGMTPTWSFSLQGSSRVDLEPSMGNRGLRLGGVAAAITGSVLLVNGFIFFGAGEAGDGKDPHALLTSGEALMPIGAILLAVGIPLILASSSSVTIREGGETRVAHVHWLPAGFTF